MSSEWFKNMCGITLTDEDMERIPRTRVELGIHVTERFAQAFGIIGTFIVGPIYAATNRNTRNWPAVKGKMTSAGTGGLILGLVAGPIVTYLMMRNQDEYKVWDRCYRLRHNKCQVRVDQFSVIGAACGAGVGAAAGSGAMFGGLMGMSGGIVFAAVYNNMGSKDKSKDK